MLADEGTHARVDEGFEVYVVDSGEGEVEDVEGDGADGGEVSVEEDGVEDTWLWRESMLVFRLCSCTGKGPVGIISDSPFNTSRTLVVSAKISRKYSGGVLRGSISTGIATGATLCMCREIK